MRSRLYLAVIVAACASAPAPGAGGPRVIPLTTSSSVAREEFERGERMMYEGQIVPAKPHFEAAIAADPALAQAYVGLAGASHNADRRKHLMRARELAASLPELERLWVEATWAGVTGELDAAAIGARIVELAPDDWRAHFYVAEIAHHHHQDFVKARPAYERAIALAPERTRPYRGLARALVALGDLAGAVAAAAQYAARLPGAAEPLELQGEILLLDGRLDDAERAFRAALALDPSSRSDDGIAMVRLNRGDTAGAVAALRHAMTKRSASLDGTPEDVLQRLGIGRTLFWTLVAGGQLDGAEVAIAEVEAAIAGGGREQASLRGEQLRIELLAARGETRTAAVAAEAAIAALRRSGIRSPRLQNALELLWLRTALAAGEPTAIERARATAFAAGPDTPSVKYAEILMAHHRREPSKVLAAAVALRGDQEAQAESRMLAAELLAAGDRDAAVALWRQVAAMHGLTPRVVMLRRHAERALAGP